MGKVLAIAWQEFKSTALTKGFLIGILITPLLILLVVGAIGLMKSLKGPQIVGTVAVIDRSGRVASFLEKRYSPEAVEADQNRDAEQLAKAIDQKTASLPMPADQKDMAKSMAAEVIKSGPKLTLQILPADADAEVEKAPVAAAQIVRKADGAPGESPRLALIVIPPEAVEVGPEGKPTTFQAFYAPKLDFEIQERHIARRVAEAIVDARLAGDSRLVAGGLSPTDVRRLLLRPEADAKTVSKQGEKDSVGELTMFIPMAFMVLLMASVMTSGQSLLTSTIEEKSSRVMEVLLSAVSPMQLMVGKIIGQMGVGLAVLLTYSALGVGSLAYFQQLGLLDASSLVYLVVFFLIAYFLVASMMAAIGSAVNDMREAQTLMTPVMIVLMLPWMIWFVIQRAPNSTLATVLSFVPGTNPFVMVIRLSGSEPVPTWQIPVGIGVGVASVLFMCWAAAKIFRIGVLMYGKPPDFRTLVRWVRMA